VRTMLPSLHQLRLHDAAPVGTNFRAERRNQRKQRDRRKVHNPQRKAAHDAKVAAAEAQRAKVAELIENTLDDDARLEIMKQLVGCPPYGQAMSDLDALCQTDSKFAKLCDDDDVWKELFPELVAKSMPPEYIEDTRGRRRFNTLAAWLPRKDVFERSMAAREFESWWEAYTVLCHFLQLHELMQASPETRRPRWWPEIVMYESDGEYPWVDSDGNENYSYDPHYGAELEAFEDWRRRHNTVANMVDVDFDDLERALGQFSAFHLGVMLEESPLPADATVRHYISAVWTKFVQAVADGVRWGGSEGAPLVPYFLGGGLGDLMHYLVGRLTPEQMRRNYVDFDGPTLWNGQELLRRQWERLRQGEEPYTWARVHREEHHFENIREFLRYAVGTGGEDLMADDEPAMWDNVRRATDPFVIKWISASMPGA
jgi:hypothetical protein